MTPEQAAEILLVQAVEEVQPEALPPGSTVDALEAAGDLDDEGAWFARRAAWLLDHPLSPWLALLRVRNAFAPSLLWCVAVPFVLGLSSNALGPRAQIHVIYNPIVLLVAWSLLSYVGLLALKLRRPPTLARPGLPRAELRLPSPEGGFLMRFARRSAARLWLRAVKGSADAREQTRAWMAVGSRFFELWERAARPWVALRTRRLMHLAALGLALGAIAGMYVRGLFFDYQMVWRSTFVQSPESVSRVLEWLLAPACGLLGRPSLDPAAAAVLLGPEGAPAAPWIHLLAATAAIFVVVPRALLAASAGHRLGRIGPALELGLGGSYFAEILAQAREIQVGRAKQEIGSAVEAECARFADRVANTVAERLFDQRIVPLLEAFRGEGGSVDALEEKIHAACHDFEDELATHVESAEQEFEEGLARDVLERVRPDLALPPAGFSRLGPAARELPAKSVRGVSGDVSGKLSRDFGTAVALAVGAVAGTLSGGFGAHLGTAMLGVLLHTTGPIGFLLGALGGALAAGAALVAGRSRVDAAVRGLSLPGPVVRLALRPARFDRLVARGRERCLTSVRELVAAKLEPLTDELADQVWARVKPLLAR
jgi:hypothetical protein